MKEENIHEEKARTQRDAEKLIRGIAEKIIQAEDCEYWRIRCKLAEAFIAASPCDPDITPAQLLAWNEYQDFLRINPPR